MRTRALVATLLAIECGGCGPKEKQLVVPDAEEFPDSPIFVIPDAPPRADARPAIDAKTAMPDAKAGTPDAKPAIDAPPPPIDAPPPPIDAMPSQPDAMPTGGLRPWGGSTAHVRALDLQLAPGFDTKICIFDTDSDTRPYAVLFGASHATVDSYSVSGGYDGTVPAGIALRMDVHDGSGTDPGDCDSGHTVALAALTSSEYYTLARTFPTAVDCATGSGSECQYWPSADGSSDACPGERTYLLDDGDLLQFGWRVVNLTSNASNIGYTTQTISDDSWHDLYNMDLDPSTSPSYSDADGTATNLYVCPAYVWWCDAPGKLTEPAAVSDIDACTNGDANWLLGMVAGSRIADVTLTTTFYIISDARELGGDAMSLTGPRVTIVIAADNVSD